MQRRQRLLPSTVGQNIKTGNNQNKSDTKQITLPHVSSYTHIFEEFDSNRTPLTPPGTKVVINSSPKNHTSWTPHGEDGCYIGP